jgi:hypothetical protein
MTRAARLTRRRFLTLAAAVTAGAALPARAAAPPRKKKSAAVALRPASLEKGIAEQKSVLALQLKTLRAYPLPPGSDPAFLFRPLRPRRLR